MKRCLNCILPDDLPSVTLDNKGKCNYCNSYEKNYIEDSARSSKKLEKKFEKLIHKTKGKGAYDCLVPLSGGKDSTYVLYLAKKKYNLNVLAFNFDNGFRATHAIENIKNAVNKLGVDLIVFKPSEEIMFKLFKTFLIRTGEFCTPCNMLMGSMGKKIGKDYGIQLILTGNSEGRMQASLEEMSPARYFDRFYYLNVIKGLISYDKVKNFIEEPYFIKGIKRLAGIGPLSVNVLEYIHTNVNEIKETLTREFGWINPANRIEHGDCLIDDLKDYLIYQKWGCSEVTGIYASLTRTGQINRDEAFKKANSEEQSHPPEILPSFLEKIGLSEKEFHKSLNKDFRDIPNIRNSRFFQLAKKSVNKIDEFFGRR